MPDPDSVMIAAGVALGATGDVPFGETFLYGRQLNPGVFLLMRAAFPWLWNDPASVISILNWTGVVLGTLTLLPLYDILRTEVSARIALACTGIWAFTPIVWEAQTYCHPLVPATFLLLCSLAFARRVGRSPRGWACLVATLVLAAVAFVVRVDVAFMLPGIAVLALASRHRKRTVATLAAACVFAGLAYFVVLNGTSGGGAGVSLQQFVDRYSEMYGMGFSLRGLPRSLTWMAMAMGVGSLAACGFGLLYRMRPGTGARRRWPSILAGVLWGLPVVVFWIPYIVPILRHYYTVSLGLVWLVGILFLARVRPGWQVPITIAVVAVNLLVPEALYRGYNATTTSTPKTPHGSFFYYHEVAANDVARLADMRREVLSCRRLGRTGEATRSVVLCRWDVFANVVYETASQGRDVVVVESREVSPETRYVRYRTSGGEIRLINYVYFEDPNVTELVSDLLVSAWKDGYCVFGPNVVRDRLIGIVPGEQPGVTGY
jgi:hypothetical protein